jgi:hypothetical protein
MRLPLDTSSIAFLCALEPQPVLAFDTKQPRADENGEPLYVVQLIALAEGEAEILAVKVPRPAVPGHPPGPPGQGDRPGRPALDDERPRWGRVPGDPDRAGRPPGEGELRREAMPERP